MNLDIIFRKNLRLRINIKIQCCVHVNIDIDVIYMYFIKIIYLFKFRLWFYALYRSRYKNYNKEITIINFYFWNFQVYKFIYVTDMSPIDPSFIVQFPSGGFFDFLRCLEIEQTIGICSKVFFTCTQYCQGACSPNNNFKSSE